MGNEVEIIDVDGSSWQSAFPSTVTSNNVLNIVSDERSRGEQEQISVLLYIQDRQLGDDYRPPPGNAFCFNLLADNERS